MSDSEKSLAWEENLLGLDEQMALFLNPKFMCNFQGWVEMC